MSKGVRFLVFLERLAGEQPTCWFNVPCGGWALEKILIILHGTADDLDGLCLGDRVEVKPRLKELLKTAHILDMDDVVRELIELL
jgi:hypothetical protein